MKYSLFMKLARNKGMFFVSNRKGYLQLISKKQNNKHFKHGELCKRRGI